MYSQCPIFLRKIGYKVSSVSFLRRQESIHYLDYKRISGLSSSRLSENKEKSCVFASPPKADEAISFIIN